MKLVLSTQGVTKMTEYYYLLHVFLLFLNFNKYDSSNLHLSLNADILLK